MGSGKWFRRPQEQINLEKVKKKTAMNHFFLLFPNDNNEQWLALYLPRNEKKMAPTKLMNGSNLGTAAATAPIIKMQPARRAICERLCFSFDMRGDNLRHSMSIGTKNCKPNVNWIAMAIKTCATWPNLNMTSETKRLT